MPALTALQYPGGKSASANNGTGRWIVSLLPWGKNSLYCEPFGGMAGVLLQRAPVKCEIYNDVNRLSAEIVVQLQKRIRDVQLECGDAVKLLGKLAALDYAVIYCDPPYAQADKRYYAHDVDRAALADVLIAQQGRVAIGGYGDEWDALGWQRHERRTTLSSHLRDQPERVEVLWTNYSPPNRLL